MARKMPIKRNERFFPSWSVLWWQGFDIRRVFHMNRFIGNTCVEFINLCVQAGQFRFECFDFLDHIGRREIYPILLLHSCHISGHIIEIADKIHICVIQWNRKFPFTFLISKGVYEVIMLLFQNRWPLRKKREPTAAWGWSCSSPCFYFFWRYPELGKSAKL